MNLELRQLAASGCKVIQVEEPTLHFMAAYFPNDTETLDFLVDAINHEIDGLDDVEVWIHTCWGNPNMQNVFDDDSYANSIEIYLERVKGDVWTIEMHDRGNAGDRPLRPVEGQDEEEDRRRRRVATARCRPSGREAWPTASARRWSTSSPRT